MSKTVVTQALISCDRLSYQGVLEVLVLLWRLLLILLSFQPLLFVPADLYRPCHLSIKSCDKLLQQL